MQLPMELHSEALAAPGATPDRAVLFLHGILGSGGNLRTVARRFVEARPHYQAQLVDLRAHGESLGGDGPDTLDAATEDVAQLCRGLALPARAVVGHSFGGKVALLLPAKQPGLAQVVAVDAAPGARPEGRGADGTQRVVRLLQDLRGPWATREAFVKDVEARGEPRPVARWLAMNLRLGEGGFRFAVDLSRIWALLGSYFDRELWPAVEAAAAGEGPAVHLVIGDASPAYREADRARARALAASAPTRVTVDVLQAGHWVHVDAPDALHQVLVNRVP